MPIINRIADFHADMAEWRQDLHAHPMIGMGEQPAELQVLRTQPAAHKGVFGQPAHFLVGIVKAGQQLFIADNPFHAADREDDDVFGGVGLDRKALIGVAEHVGERCQAAIGRRSGGAVDKGVGCIKDGDVGDGRTDPGVAAGRQRAGNGDDVGGILGDHAQITQCKDI